MKSETAKIKVVGVGGAGCSVVEYLHTLQINNVDLIACNTDEEALAGCPIPEKLLIKDSILPELMGKGKPEIARQAGLLKTQDIMARLSDHTEIVFVVAGLGGGAGTGAAPVFAQVAKKLGIITIGIVILPFSFEGAAKVNAAEAGLQEMRKATDAILVISNQKLRMHYGDLTMKEAFGKVDAYVANTVCAIADIISVAAEVNVDIDDIRMVLHNTGTAIAGTATIAGENRAMLAAQQATNYPLLLVDNIHGAQKILLSIMSGPEAELEMEELTLITEYIQDKAGLEAEVIFGHGIDGALNNSIRVTVIATWSAVSFRGEEVGVIK